MELHLWYKMLIIVCCFILLISVYSSNIPDSPKTLRQRRLEKRLTNARNIVTPLVDDIKNHPLLQLSSNENSLVYPISSLSSLSSSLSSPLSSSLSSPLSSSPIKHHITFYSFNDLFGEQMDFSGLFNSNSAFRADIRQAARNDFFVQDDAISNEANNLLKDPRSSMSSKWDSNTNDYNSLTKVFQKYNFPSYFTGKVFMSELTKLCPETPNRFNSWMDIIGVKKKAINHSFHQDSGLEQTTVMIGFPPENDYEGLGVFSHAVKLSHRLPIPPIELQNQPRLWSSISNDLFDEQYIVRPMYKEGKEIMTYDDRDIFHSAPDFAYRDSIWRIM